MRHRIAAIALALLTTAAAAHAEDAPSFTASSDTVRADENGSVQFDFTLHNPGRTGLYPDSLYMTTVDEDPGVDGLPKSRTTSLPSFVRVLAPAAAGEDQQYTYSLQLPFEHGRVTFRLVAHDAAHATQAFSTTCIVAGSALGDAYPSSTLLANGKRVEVVRMAAENANGPAPGVLIVHGEHTHARRMLNTGRLLTARGWNVVLVSQPGHGTSSGPADLAGPLTQAALTAAFEDLRKMPGVDPKRLAVWGDGTGGTAALVFAAKRKEVVAVVAQSAIVDLWAAYRAASPERQQEIVAQAGRDSVAWRARSPLASVQKLSAAVCVIQSSDRDTTLSEPLRAFGTRFDVAGNRATIAIDDAKRHVRAGDANRIAAEFLRQHFLH